MRLNPDLCKRILTIGCEHDKPKGGVAYVLSVYKDIFYPFNFIATTCAGSKFKKSGVLFVAVISFVWRMLSDRDIKIIHIHGASYNSFFRKRIFINIARLFNKSIVYHIHGAEFKLFAAERYDTVRAALDKCDVIVALSESWLDWFENELGIRHVRVIPNIIPNPAVCENKKCVDRLNLLFLGVIGNRKGIFDLLAAIQRNFSVFRGKIRLFIGGDGESSRLEKIIEDGGLEDMVVNCGWVDGARKAELLNKADVYVLPSYNEGLPISILEAMSYGMPVISTPVGGIPEIVGEDNGFLVQPGDIDAIGEKILFFVERRDAVRRMGDRSTEKIKPYLPDAVVESLTALYEQLLAD